MGIIYLQNFLIEYLEKCNFLKIADTNSIFAGVKSIMQLLCQHFFADVKEFELERLHNITPIRAGPHSHLPLSLVHWCSQTMQY